MTATLATTPIADTAFARLESEGRLLQPSAQGQDREGRAASAFAANCAHALCAQAGGRGASPELLSQQVMAVANLGEKHMPFFAGYLLSFEYLKDVAEVLGDTLSAGGKYFLFCNNIDLSKKYQVPYKGAIFYVLPIDESHRLQRDAGPALPGEK